jgi:hypothetical protein
LLVGIYQSRGLVPVGPRGRDPWGRHLGGASQLSSQPTLTAKAASRLSETRTG